MGQRRLPIPEEKVEKAIGDLFPAGRVFARSQTPIDVNDVPRVTTAEVIAAADRMKPGKAPRPDGVPPEAVAERKGVSPFLRRVISSYLQNRWITEGGRTYKMSAGVPQVSVLGPTLWNIVYDDVLRLLIPSGIRLLAYADDLALVAKATMSDELEQQVNEALERISF